MKEKKNTPVDCRPSGCTGEETCPTVYINHNQILQHSTLPWMNNIRQKDDSEPGCKNEKNGIKQLTEITHTFLLKTFSDLWFNKK